VPSNQLVVLVVKCFNNSVSWLTKTNYSEVTCSVEHVVVVGSPFITGNDVLLRLVAFKLLVSRISSVLIFECFGTLWLDILHNKEPTTVIVSELDWQAWLKFLFLPGTDFTKDLNRTQETNLT